MKRALIVLTAAACMVLLSHPSKSQNPRNLQKSRLCSIHGGGFAIAGGAPPGANKVTMNNDGGWCGHLSKTVNGSLVTGVPMHVSRQPAHGQVSITVLSGGTNVLYKPEPGYVGPDSFAVLNEMLNIERPYDVEIRK